MALAVCKGRNINVLLFAAEARKMKLLCDVALLTKIGGGVIMSRARLNGEMKNQA